MARHVRITHVPSGTVIAEGPIGWSITPFEGNFYVRKRYLRGVFKTNFFPGLCVYKFVYVWLDLVLASERVSNLAWRYVLPNPLFPFVWFRVGLPGDHPDLRVERFERE